ncbi:MAG: hypothetical protein ACJ71O_01635 [Nitrososphaeraceae archaeon]
MDFGIDLKNLGISKTTDGKTVNITNDNSDKKNIPISISQDGRLNVYPLLVIRSQASEDELSVTPEYMNVDAYNKLIQTVYPFNMPFNLWVEETRTYLEHLGTSRYLTALDEIIKRAFDILETSPDNREKLQAMELFKDTHLIKLELLSNATTIDSALNYIRGKQQEQKVLTLDSTADAT